MAAVTARDALQGCWAVEQDVLQRCLLMAVPFGEAFVSGGPSEPEGVNAQAAERKALCQLVGAPESVVAA